MSSPPHSHRFRYGRVSHLHPPISTNHDAYHCTLSFIIAVATTKTAPRYFSLFLMVGGMFGSYNVALAWISSTFARPRAKRAAAYATINSLGNSKSLPQVAITIDAGLTPSRCTIVAQIWSPYLYDASYSPRYTVSRLSLHRACGNHTH